MNKHVRRSIIGGDETEALLSIEKLNGTDWHCKPPNARIELGSKSLRCFLRQLNYLRQSRNGIKHLHVEDRVRSLDCQASSFGRLIRLVRRFSLPIDLEAELARIGSLALAQGFMRWVRQVGQSLASVAVRHPNGLPRSPYQRWIVAERCLIVLFATGSFLRGAAIKPSRCACFRLSLRIRRIPSLLSRANFSEGFS
jgi:hypothetical protein